MINILILAAGASSSEGDAKDWYPVCISEMDGIPLIERQIQLCNNIRPYKLIVALKEQEIQKFHLDNIVKLLEPNSVVVPVASETRGAACTALLSCEYIDNEDELFTELAHSYNQIHAQLGYYPYTISYPVGSYNQKVIECSKKVGYQMGLAVDFNIYNPIIHSNFNIPRLELYNESYIKTLLRAEGIYYKIKNMFKS